MYLDQFRSTCHCSLTLHSAIVKLLNDAKQCFSFTYNRRPVAAKCFSLTYNHRPKVACVRTQLVSFQRGSRLVESANQRHKASLLISAMAYFNLTVYFRTYLRKYIEGSLARGKAVPQAGFFGHFFSEGHQGIFSVSIKIIDGASDVYALRRKELFWQYKIGNICNQWPK